MPITATHFEYMRKLLHDRSAITLDPGKEYMVESRLTPVAKKNGFRTASEFIERLQSLRVNGLHAEAVEAMTTNETYFFRDVHPFTALQSTVIPELLKNRSHERKLSIWCGASSTGQEPYSIAMLLDHHFPQLGSWKIQMLATDLNVDVLNRAREGRYNELEISRGLPPWLLVKYFRKEAGGWCLKDNIRRMVEYRPMNLAEAWPALPAMDLVFLRNVLIYFGLETKRAILGKIAKVLKPDGYLFLGTAETTLNIDDSFKRAQMDKAVAYQLAKAVKAPAPALAAPAFRFAR
jgi:chemotaxis protein methyltransferase CheR